jgi:hypothetical protein
MLYSHSFFSSLKNKIHNPIFPIVRDFGFFVFTRIYNIASRFFIPLSRKIIQTAEVQRKKHAIYIACILFFSKSNFLPAKARKSISQIYDTRKHGMTLFNQIYDTPKHGMTLFTQIFNTRKHGKALFTQIYDTRKHGKALFNKIIDIKQQFIHNNN